MATRANRPIGQLFSEVYGERKTPAVDSKKFRIQLTAIFDETIGARGGFSRYLAREAGIVIESVSGYDMTVYRFDKFFQNGTISDVLDSITHAVRFLEETDRHKDTDKWIRRVQAAFNTQNLNYELDEQGGVHHRIDAAYAHSRSLTLACLAGAKFEAAHDEIEKAFAFLTQIPPDNKLAVINTFLAAENLFKMAAGTNSGLAKNSAMNDLGPCVQALYSGADDATKSATARMVASFASWADACHPYRHGQNDASIVAPPDEVAITLVTTGADYIRWLVQLAK